MAKDFAKQVYKSRRWQKCRKAYIAERILVDGGLCEECHERLGYIVHHKVMLTEANISDPDIVYSFENLEYVCKQCHDQFEGHGVGKAITELVMFDEHGDPIPPLISSCNFADEHRG